MKLTKEQFELLKGHLQNVAPNGITCPVCGSKHWSASDTIFQCTEFTGPVMNIGAGVSIMPFVVLSCDRCQNSIMLNALKIGLVDNDLKNEKQ